MARSRGRREGFSIGDDADVSYRNMQLRALADMALLPLQLRMHWTTLKLNATSFPWASRFSLEDDRTFRSWQYGSRTVLL